MFGVLVGYHKVGEIINAAFPVLMFIYPITIVLILLNILSDKWVTPMIFKSVVIITFIFSIPDFIVSLNLGIDLSSVQSYIPLSSQGLGWFIPAFIMFGLTTVLNLTVLRSQNT